MIDLLNNSQMLMLVTGSGVGGGDPGGPPVAFSTVESKALVLVPTKSKVTSPKNP